jgi:hypothetical protein
MAKTKVPKEEKKTVQKDLEGNEALPIESVNEKTQTIVEFSVDGFYLRTTREAVAKLKTEDDPDKRLAFVQARIRAVRENLPVPKGTFDDRIAALLGMLDKYGN